MQIKEDKTKQQALSNPFQFPDADIIIRARGVDFRVHKLILSHASTGFEDKFSLPPISRESIPVIEVPEDAQTMHDVLSLIYRNTDPVDLDNITTLRRVLVALRKYSMDNLRSIVGRVLQTHINSDPIRVFAIACIVNGREIARLAAKETLKLEFGQILDYDVPEVNQIRAGTFRKLLLYHRKCGDLASQTIRAHASKCPVTYHASKSARTVENAYVDCRQWWTEYVERMGEDAKSHPILPDYGGTELVRGFCDLTVTKRCYTCSPIASLTLIQLGERVEQEVRAALENVGVGLDDDDFSIQRLS
ncbi:hypothetical protein QCA50_004178 [Cerrena zonata]|uniref:BTB domain-containing protein n=1 Tax=Cerrena zonata TaxID=2478898 RepID=A0AAW0GG58_9APHY